MKDLDQKFSRVFEDDKLFLPIGWDGNDFLATLKGLYDRYIYRLEENDINFSIVEIIKRETDSLIKAVGYHQKNLTAKAFDSLKSVMAILQYKPLVIYRKSAKMTLQEIVKYDDEDTLRLFRARKDETRIDLRKDMFHVPFNHREWASTNRYSILGFPCLYLGTSLELCCDEISPQAKGKFYASAYKIERDENTTGIVVKVIELGVKPQDFSRIENNEDTADANKASKRKLDVSRVDKEYYLLWYPLIAACSYIRNDMQWQYAPEYIIPQLLMQWVIEELEQKKELIGFRYFSCKSHENSEKGFNYVFPTSGENMLDTFPYCKVLTKSFRMTKPVCVDDYGDVSKCEEMLRDMNVKMEYMYPDN